MSSKDRPGDMALCATVGFLSASESLLCCLALWPSDCKCCCKCASAANCRRHKPHKDLPLVSTADAAFGLTISAHDPSISTTAAKTQIQQLTVCKKNVFLVLLLTNRAAKRRSIGLDQDGALLVKSLADASAAMLRERTNCFFCRDRDTTVTRLKFRLHGG